MIKTLRIPIVTAVTAGRGIPDDLTDWEITGFRDVRLADPDSNARYIGVPVEGDSLIDQHILEGDILVCRLTRDYIDGELGIWQTPNGRTCKYCYYDFDNTVVLHNGGSWRQLHDANDIRLLALVVKVERDMRNNRW